MSILKGDLLSGSFNNFRRNEVRRLIKEISSERRAGVLEQIRLRQFLKEDGDEELLKLAAKYLSEGEK